MLAAVEPLGRELPGNLFISIKEDYVTRGMPHYFFKCENIAEVAPTFKNNGLVTRQVMSEVFLEKEQEK